MPEPIESVQRQRAPSKEKDNEPNFNLVDLSAADTRSNLSDVRGGTVFTQSNIGNALLGIAAGSAGGYARELSPQLVLGAEAAALQQRITLGVFDAKSVMTDWSVNSINRLDNTIARTQALETQLRDFGHTPTPLPERGLPLGVSKDLVAARSAWLTEANANLRTRMHTGLYSRGTENSMSAGQLVATHLDNSATVAESATVAADIMERRLLPASPVKGVSSLELSRRLLTETSEQTSMMMNQVKANQRSATMNAQIWEHQLTRAGFDRTPVDHSNVLGRHDHAAPKTWLEHSTTAQQKFLATNPEGLATTHPDLARVAQTRVNAGFHQVEELRMARAIEHKLAIISEGESMVMRRARPQLGRALAVGVVATTGVMATDFLAERAAANLYGENSDAVRAVQPNLYGTMATTAALMSGANWQTRIGRGVAVWAASKSLNFVLDKQLRDG